MTNALKAPFPWFGGKSKIAHVVWDHFGQVEHYIEPFFGSGAVLLGAPIIPKLETINDADAHLVNFWRAVKYDPELVALHCQWPVHELEMHAWHQRLSKMIPYVKDRLEADPEWFHPIFAARWVWGLSAWIGGGWCGPKGITRGAHQLPKLTSPNGVHRLSLRTHHRLPKLAPSAQNGIHAQRVANDIVGELLALSERLQHVRAACGDWERIVSECITADKSPTAIFLDPPYISEHPDNKDLYGTKDGDVFPRVFSYCVKNGNDRRLRIALCYYDGSEVDGDNVSDKLRALGWEIVEWKADSGMRRGKNKNNQNAARERIAFSPGCLRAAQASLFEART